MCVYIYIYIYIYISYFELVLATGIQLQAGGRLDSGRYDEDYHNLALSPSRSLSLSTYYIYIYMCTYYYISYP